MSTSDFITIGAYGAAAFLSCSGWLLLQFASGKLTIHELARSFGLIFLIAGLVLVVAITVGIVFL